MYDFYLRFSGFYYCVATNYIAFYVILFIFWRIKTDNIVRPYSLDEGRGRSSFMWVWLLFCLHSIAFVVILPLRRWTELRAHLLFTILNGILLFTNSPQIISCGRNISTLTSSGFVSKRICHNCLKWICKFSHVAAFQLEDMVFLSLLYQNQFVCVSSLNWQYLAQ